MFIWRCPGDVLFARKPTFGLEPGRVIDLLSDTVTKPTPQMMAAMQTAVVGDDVYGEDPTTNRLESRCAVLFDKEAACFVPSGTMANLLSILAWCHRGAEVLVGDESDIYNYEAGGASAVGGVVYHSVPTKRNGTLSLEDINLRLRDRDDLQCAPAGLLCLETPHNRLGGLPLPLDYLAEVSEFCSSQNLPIHMDGARVFNASLAQNVPVAHIARHADSLQFCFSKSLAAPIGSAVLGSASFIQRVRRLRKMLGGGMRQTGYMAAAAEVAIETMVGRLQEDHARARALALGLADIPGLRCNPTDVQTNMVFFQLRDPSIHIERFLIALQNRGVRMGLLGHERIRAVVHYHIGDEEIVDAISAVREVINSDLSESSETSRAVRK